MTALAAVLVMANLIDHHRTRQQEHIVLAFGNVHRVGITERKPLLRYRRHGPAVTGEGIFVVEKTALGLVIVGTRHIYDEMAAEEIEQILAHCGDMTTISVD